ncbi:MAG: cobalt transporter, permease protein CbiQ [Bacillota bacterium]|nr:cobalt transporter, permease protein CbiQ [Bacillota bacterium]
MINIKNSIYKIRFLDEISQKNTFIHKLHPLVKLIVSIFYIIMTVSYGKYEIFSMMPLLIYLVLVFNLGDIPLKPILKRSLIVLPIVIGLGIFNPILDNKPIYIFHSISISRGWVSYLSLIIKSFLSVICALLLISTTSMDKLAKALQQLHIPKIIIMQLLFTYRYIYVLLEEFSNIWTAYSLRAPNQSGIHYKLWGPLLGQVLIRTYDRAERIYSAMKLRGYNTEFNNTENDKLILKDYIYLIFWIVFLLVVKFYNIPVLLGSIFTGA